MGKFTVHLANEKTITVEADGYEVFASGFVTFHKDGNSIFVLGKNAYAFIEQEEAKLPLVEWDNQPANLLLG